MAGAYANATIWSAKTSGEVKRGQFVQFDSNGKIEACTAIDDQILGVYDPRDNDDAATGDAIGVVVHGQAQVFAGATISAGDTLVVCTASGLSGYAAPLGDLTNITDGKGCHIAGVALEAAAKNEAFTMLVQPGFYVKRKD